MTSTLSLDGSYDHPHWLAFLCAGLAERGVSVVSGKASRTAPLTWSGSLEVSGDATGVDPAALAGVRPVARDTAPLRLGAHQLRRRPDGQLELHVDAPDELGFLGRLLSRVSLLTLLPSEVEIATVGGRVADRLVLGGIGTAVPAAEVERALVDMLGRLAA